MLGAFDRDNWYEIWAVLRANKLRTALTAFGVAWGIIMLIVMLGFGSAMQAGTQRNMKGRATNLLFVWGQTTTEGYDGMKPGRQVRFRTADIERLRRLPSVEWLAPRLQLGGWHEPVHRGLRQQDRGVQRLRRLPRLQAHRRRSSTRPGGSSTTATSPIAARSR